jgi:hypothetical protein
MIENYADVARSKRSRSFQDLLQNRLRCLVADLRLSTLLYYWCIIVCYMRDDGGIFVLTLVLG